MKGEKKVKKLLDKVHDLDDGWETVRQIMQTWELIYSLKQERLRQGLSRKHVAEELGWSEERVAQFEDARYPDPHLSTLAKYAFVLGLTLNPSVSQVYSFDPSDQGEVEKFLDT